MLGFGQEFSYYFRSLTRLLYPPYCVLCRTPLILEESYLCVPCAQTIKPLKTPVCLKCSHPLPPYGHQRSLCSQCRSQRPYYDRGYTLVRYQDSVKTIFHQIKFQKKLWLFKIFSELLKIFSSSSEIRKYEMIIPIPLDPKRERQRGFNQALIIAQMLKREKREQTPPICGVLGKKKENTPSKPTDAGRTA